ncbi:valine--tRNA ligase [Pilimelia anulata]|uniref:Valine--tRNA ligase n=1 Tax=Pilimelia anulata TaxID=53371 RepID=A0A8J3B2Z6_9ACTN|nr:valine--tRNA ligase [Pilimelia anulata]GGJ74073.1 valine--tRNA ligase [Pilimelia anulata]
MTEATPHRETAPADRAAADVPAPAEPAAAAPDAPERAETGSGAEVGGRTDTAATNAAAMNSTDGATAATGDRPTPPAGAGPTPATEGKAAPATGAEPAPAVSDGPAPAVGDGPAPASGDGSARDAAAEAARAGVAPPAGGGSAEGAGTTLPSQYPAGEVEQKRYAAWLSAGVFAADAASDRPPYAIVIPPPNVTGSLHIGHALDHTIQDALIRRKRMQGHEALWLPGMDHAGIATQNVVERQLAAQGLSRHDLGREAFVERVWQWKAESGGAILGQMKRLGDSVDWSRERFTMDEGLSRAVQTIFKKLYDDGLVYRAERIINWCPRCLTALSDIEVEHSDDDGELVSIRYGEGDASIVVATTRAETMLGDTAVAVHPDDDRYRSLIGTEVELPLTGRSIPIVADPHVDPAFGTGAVKVTPAHDPNDFEIGQRHGLPSRTVMDERGVITVAGPFEGLDRFEARPAIVAALREQGRIVAEKRPYVHAVGHCSRCRTTVEPRLSLQWFVRTEPLARAAGDAVRDGRVRIEPPELAKRYFAWVDNMHDWCISRQLWWGHRIPVWYGPDGEVRCVGPDEQPPAGWTRDEDVLDTWFSSALWPFSTLGWPERTPDLAKFYPTSVLVTGYDILFFWVARMMMFGLYAMDGTPPFGVVALHGMVRDQHGKKMSKSFGNVIDPLDWIDRFGADATRFTLARGANPGGDVPVSEEWCQGSRAFCNKLWNVTRFALLNGATVAGSVPPPSELSAVDRWILSRLQDVVAQADEQFEAYEFAKACDVLYHFAWDDVCDWYVELAKPVLAAGGPAADASRRVLGHVLDELLRLLHPVIPFVTDELWTALTGSLTVATAAWPIPAQSYLDPAAEVEIGRLQRVVTEVRRFRSDQGVKPAQRVPAELVGLADAGLAAHEPLIRSIARLDPPGDGFAASASLAVTGTISVGLDTSGTIDLGAERARLAKDAAVAEKEIEQCRAKLGNEAFVGKAPAAVVDKIRTRLAAAEADRDRIAAALAALPAAGGA